MKLDKVMNIIKSKIAEAYKIQADCWEDSESDSYDKNYMKEKKRKRMGWLGCTRHCKEN